METFIRPPRRRNFLSAAAASLAAWLFTSKADGAETNPDVVTRRMRQGDVPTQPLDTMLCFERGDEHNGEPMTHEVLSLVQQERGKNSYPWTLYTSLETYHENGDGCVHCARLHKHGPGWASGIHSEVFCHGRAVAIGANIEMSNDYAGKESQQVIGLNIQAVGGPTAMQYAIQIHDKDEHAHFATGIGVNGRGAVGVDLSGKYDVGLHTRGNNIRLGEGACIELDDKGEVKIRYRDGKIEFFNGERRVAFLDMGGADRAL
jgi:hypothetical protein